MDVRGEIVPEYEVGNFSPDAEIDEDFAEDKEMGDE